jgi:ubiquinone/menaquinone biosynthesis C-methylase UbiE
MSSHLTEAQSIFIDQVQKTFFYEDGIYYSGEISNFQNAEIKLRNQIFRGEYLSLSKTLKQIQKHHSIEVMRHELRKFLSKVPSGGVVLDVGSGWGWHWQGISKFRPDLTICLLDFSDQSLLRAKSLLQEETANMFIYICSDALSLKLSDASIDAYWSVQTLQHVPEFKSVIAEANRVLKRGSQFATYSLNNQKFIGMLYRLFGRKYVVQGEYAPGIAISRASNHQAEIIESIFDSPVATRYSEVLFSPELLLRFPGKSSSILGKLDRYLSGDSYFASIFGRQCSFHATKR